MRVAFVGEPADLELAAPATLAGHEIVETAGAEVTVAFGAWASEAPSLRWQEVAAEEAAVRTVAPAGEAPWRRMPWPAADALFDLAGPPADGPVVVAGGPGERRTELVAALGSGGVEVREADEITVSELRDATAVVLCAAGPGPLPARAPAVMAAGRLLITDRCTTTFGLLPGVDHLAARSVGEVIAQVHSVLRHPEAYALMRVLGREAVERHRATVVHRRLLVDMALEDAVPG